MSSECDPPLALREIPPDLYSSVFLPPSLFDPFDEISEYSAWCVIIDFACTLDSLGYGDVHFMILTTHFFIGMNCLRSKRQKKMCEECPGQVELPGSMPQAHNHVPRRQPHLIYHVAVLEMCLPMMDTKVEEGVQVEAVGARVRVLLLPPRRLLLLAN